MQSAFSCWPPGGQDFFTPALSRSPAPITCPQPWTGFLSFLPVSPPALLLAKVSPSSWNLSCPVAWIPSPLVVSSPSYIFASLLSHSNNIFFFFLFFGIFTVWQKLLPYSNRCAQACQLCSQLTIALLLCVWHELSTELASFTIHHLWVLG